MRYQTNPNVVCAEMFGRYFLVAASSEWHSIPYVQEINEQAAVCWELLESERSVEEMTGLLSGQYGISEIEACTRLELFFHDLVERGYVLEEGADV